MCREQRSGRAAVTGSILAPPECRSWAKTKHSVTGVSQSPRDAETGLLALRRDKHQPATVGTTNTRDRNVTNKIKAT